MESITNLLEALMIFCFGLSWPISIRKSWVSRTAKGKSLFFEVFLLIGYIFGIGAKLVNHFASGAPLNYVFAVYILNLVMVSCNIVVYFINRRHDAN